MTRLLSTALLAISPLAAQIVVSARAGVVYTIQGAATIDGQPIAISPEVPLPQLEPSQILASTRGHAEILLGQDAILWTGNDTQLRLDSDNVDSPRVTLLSGVAILELKHTRSGRHVTIDIGSQTPAVSTAGVYRFDRNPDRIRVWSGSLTPNQPFDKRDKDDLHYFAAFRSLALEEESGRFEHWKYQEHPHPNPRAGVGGPRGKIYVGDFRHAGFDLEMSLPIGAARAKYMVAGEAGLVNAVGGAYRLGLTPIESGNGRVELFLGLGITARLNHNSRLRILDTKATAPVAALEAGEVMIEVAHAAANNHLSLHISDSVAEIHKPGLYRFNQSGAVAVSPAKYGDEFFAWNRDRSLDLWESDADFMADWQPYGPGKARHKQYGIARTSTPPITNFPAPIKPSTTHRPDDPKPAIVDQPIDKTPGER